MKRNAITIRAFKALYGRGATVAVDIDDMRYEDRYSVFTVRKEAHLSLRTDDITAVHAFMNGFLESTKRKKR